MPEIASCQLITMPVRYNLFDIYVSSWVADHRVVSNVNKQWKNICPQKTSPAFQTLSHSIPSDFSLAVEVGDTVYFNYQCKLRGNTDNENYLLGFPLKRQTGTKWTSRLSFFVKLCIRGNIIWHWFFTVSAHHYRLVNLLPAPRSSVLSAVVLFLVACCCAAAAVVIAVAKSALPMRSRAQAFYCSYKSRTLEACSTFSLEERSVSWATHA